MHQITLRVPDELADDLRAAAERDGKSMNAWATDLLRAALDPSYGDDEQERLRERLRRAGLLVEAPRRRAERPGAEEVAIARRRAGRGTPLSDLVAEGRR